jgi:hypothetical protein
VNHLPPSECTAPTVSRARRRLSRSLSPSRWSEYRGLLEGARRRGYRVVSLEDWIVAPERSPDPVLVLRHDVDQHPRSALAMARIEESLGLRSTFYFRWRTAQRSVIRTLRERGFAVGLHYETLSRRALALGAGPEDDLSPLIDESRDLLRREVAVFIERFGPIRSICAHGDSRVPHVRNALLVRGQDCSSFGIEFEGNEAMAGRGLACWLTDRSAPEGRWRDGLDPLALFESRTAPILCLTHPNNWASGAGLWLDRAVRAIRGRDDEPPL